jgi:hypothetical protein
VIAGDFAQPAHVLVAVDTLQRIQRASQAGIGVSDGQPNSRATVVDSQNVGAMAFAGRNFLS